MKVWSFFWSWYFQPKALEVVGGIRLYRLLGIRFFKRYLPTSGDLVSRAFGVRRIHRARGQLKESLVRHEQFTRTYEGRHIFGAVSMLALSWWSISVHHRGNWLALLGANLLLNGYPIMLQRYNRIRVQAALRKLGSSLTPRSSGPDCVGPLNFFR